MAGTHHPARSAVHLALLGVLAALVVAATPAQTPSDACARDRFEDFTYGRPADWDVVTSGTDPSAPWHRHNGPQPWVEGVAYASEVAGAGTKDDRLITGDFVATAATDLRFVHEPRFGSSSGGLLEVSTDGGATWAPVDRDWIRSDPYTGEIAGTGPAWTGVGPADASTRPRFDTTVDLGELDGRTVRLAWRVVATGTASPGRWLLGAVTLRRAADPACVDGTNPDLACTTDLDIRLGDGLPEGWSVDTALNDDGTSTWSASDFLAWSGLGTSAAGRAAKDDRLVSAPFRATAATTVGIVHLYGLEPGRDGGVLETAAEGAGWSPVAAEQFDLGGYDATLADGRPAWTGASGGVGTVSDWAARTYSGVRLGGDGATDVRLRLRLLQDTAGAASLPGYQWTVIQVVLKDVVVPGCSGGRVLDSLSTCDSLDPPARFGVAGVTDDGTAIDVHVRVALDVEDGAEIALLARDPGTRDEAEARFAALEAEVRSLLSTTGDAYLPVGIDLTYSYDLLAPLNADGTPRDRPDDRSNDVLQSASGGGGAPYYDELFDIARRQYGDAPPSGSDLVFIASDVRDGDVGGVAACVGGIAYPDQSFAIGRIDLEETPSDLGGVVFARNTAARTAAHEIGHLFGAQHHLSNCTEAAIGWGPAGDTSGPCTLMAVETSLIWPRFSSLNTAIVRGYAAGLDSAR